MAFLARALAAVAPGICAVFGSSCGDESFSYELRVRINRIDADSEVRLFVGGEPLTGTVSANVVAFEYSAEFEEGEELLPLDLVVDGEPVGAIAVRLDGCRSYCPGFDTVIHTACFFETGERAGLCGSLSCFKDGQSCGGYIE